MLIKENNMNKKEKEALIEKFRKEAEPQISNMIADFMQWNSDDLEHEEMMELISQMQEQFFSKIYKDKVK